MNNYTRRSGGSSRLFATASQPQLHLQAVNQRLQNSVSRLAEETAALVGVRECLRWFSSEKAWVLDQQVRLCRIPAPTFFEQERARWMAARFKELGCEVRLDGAGNVLAFPRKAAGEPYIVLSAHLDTVLAPRTPEDIVAEAGGRLRGPGVSDNGAGLAALLAVAAALWESPALPDLHCGLLLLANVGEEGEGNLSGTRYFCHESAAGSLARAFVVLDGPATDHITTTALESRRFEVIVTGNGGHSWSDFGMGNPLHALIRSMSLFIAEAPGIDSATGRNSFNVGVVEGGASVNAIPSLARAKVDLRSETSAGVAQLVKCLTAAVERGVEMENAAARTGRVFAETRLIGSRPGGRLADSAPVLQALLAVDSYLGVRSRLDCASTDANIPLSMGKQAVSIGAGGTGGGSHTASEWYHPAGRDLGLKRVFLTLAMLLRDPELAQDAT